MARSVLAAPTPAIKDASLRTPVRCSTLIMDVYASRGESDAYLLHMASNQPISLRQLSASEVLNASLPVACALTKHS